MEEQLELLNRTTQPLICVYVTVDGHVTVFTFGPGLLQSEGQGHQYKGWKEGHVEGQTVPRRAESCCHAEDARDWEGPQRSSSEDAHG